MATGVTARTQPASEALVREKARRLVAAGRARLLLLRATPRWSGPESMTVDGARVLVRPAVSQLAALEAIADASPDDFLILLTDRTDHDLGDAVLVRAERQRVEQVDEWDAIPEVFGARTVAPDLRRAGSWVPSALLDHMPAGGWPAVPSGTVGKDAAFSALLAQVLRLPVRDDLDGVRVLEALDAPEARVAWQATDDPLRSGLIEWAWEGLGPVGALALLAAATPGAVSVIAVALAADVLWPAGPAGAPEPDQIAARTRIEARFGGRVVRPTEARALADAARGVIARMEVAEHSARIGLLAQAEALLGDLGWADGAARSDVLPAGFRARLRELARVVGGALVGEARSKALEGALRDLLQHLLERRQADEVRAARMAVRLERWLATPDGGVPAGLGAVVLGHVHDGAWVDRAAAAIWTGSADAAVADSYRGLYARVAARRAAADERAAALLAPATARDEAPDGVVLIEDLLARVVVPLTAARPVLLVVLDGMSVAVATELVDEAVGAGWVEHVPESSGRRTGALAVLPTVTAFSRTSLFAGHLTAGAQDTEKRAFRATFGGPVFHKDDLRAPAGQRLPAALTAEVEDPAVRAVAVVLNTIDDALDKQDPGGKPWTIDAVQHLPALLNAAALAGRVVVLTSDHGHVVERGGEARPVAGADSRWRPVESGPAGPGEVLVRGRRVLAPGGAVVLPWREDLRYGAKRAGYHGGASLAEVTIPVIVLDRPGGATPPGWVPAAPPAPAWWNDPVVRREPVAGGRRAARRTERVGDARIDLAAPPGETLPPARTAGPPATPPGQGVLDLGLSTPAPVAAAPSSLVDALLASGVYRSQHERAGRHALGDATVRAIVGEMAARGGRAHRDTLAAAAGIPAAEVAPKFSALSRLLNVDGYAVVAWDADRVTLRLDEALLREQFALGGVRR